MHTKTQRLMLRGGMILVGALLVSTVGGWARGASADADRAPGARGGGGRAGAVTRGGLGGVPQQREGSKGGLEGRRLRLGAARALIQHPGQSRTRPDPRTALYDAAPC